MGAKLMPGSNFSDSDEIQCTFSQKVDQLTVNFEGFRGDVEKSLTQIHAFQANLRAETRDDIGSLRSDQNSMRTEIRIEISGIRAEISGIRVEMQSAHENLRNEVRAEISGIRAEVQSAHENLRNEVRAEISGIRTEISGIRTEISGLRAEMLSANDELRKEIMGSIRSFKATAVVLFATTVLAVCALVWNMATIQFAMMKDMAEMQVALARQADGMPNQLKAAPVPDKNRR